MTGCGVFPDEVDLALADGFLEIQIAEHESGHFLQQNPALWTGEAIFGVIALVTRTSPRSICGSSRRSARMRAIPAFLADARRVLRGCSTRLAVARAARVRRRRAAVRHGTAALVERRCHRTHTIGRALFDDRQSSARAAGQAFDAFARWLESDLPGRRLSAHERGPGPPRACSFAVAIGARRRSTLCWPKHATRCRRSRPSSSDGRARTSGGWPAVQEQLADAHPAR